MSQKTGGMHPYIVRGILAFVGGMALSAVSFVVEKYVIETAQAHLKA